jgi:hypothetical protein
VSGYILGRERERERKRERERERERETETERQRNWLDPIIIFKGSYPRT